MEFIKEAYSKDLFLYPNKYQFCVFKGFCLNNSLKNTKSPITTPKNTIIPIPNIGSIPPPPGFPLLRARFLKTYPLTRSRLQYTGKNEI